jgi:PAS domain-containing protein
MMNRLLIFLCLLLLSANVSAQTDSVRVYTDERPLVFEDSESIWPYSFLNEKGEPEGYCIDLIKMLMSELGIPYVIQLKPHQEVLQDLKAGRADLILGLGDVYEEKFGHYGQTTVTLLTQSVATPKIKSVAIKSFRDLGNKGQQVIVKDSGLCHHLMVDYGWDDHVVVSHDIAKSIQEVNEKQEGQIVWNTLTLKWLINYYHLENLQLTPVNMPHGETKFIATDRHLLELIDKTYVELCATDQLSALEKKWLYPDREAPERPIWEWYLAGFALVLLVITIIYLAHKLQQVRRFTKDRNNLGRQLAQFADNSHVRIWTYDAKKHQFAWHNKKGKVARTYTPEDFAQYYSKEDFTLLKEALDRLITQHVDSRGHVVKEETLELKAKDVDSGDSELRDSVIVLSILSYDNHGKPSVIMGTIKDVTREHHLKQMNSDRVLRYWSVFYNDEAGIIFFDKDGYLQNANPIASELFQCDIDKTVKKHVHLNDFFHTAFADLHDVDGYQGIETVDNRTINYQMKVVCNDEKELIGIFVFCI